MNHRSKAFTLAETLIVVAIISILSGISFVELPKISRNMEQKEMDSMAMSLYVAAQNHLTMARSQDYPGVSNFGVSDTETDVYYFVVGGDYSYPDDNLSSALHSMLPYGSIDDTIRIGGSYIIRYNRESGVVLDVFYAEKTGKYGHTFATGEYPTLLSEYKGDEKAEARKSYGDDKSVIGWFGAEKAADITGIAKDESVKAPVVDVMNDDTLHVLITNPNEKTAVMQLVVKGKKSNAEFVSNIWTDPNAKDFVLDDITFYDSSATIKYGHFANVNFRNVTTGGIIGEFSCSGSFIPGEDLDIQATATVTSTSGAITAFSNVVTTNSLFGDATDLTNGKVEISSIRHLENLSKSISGFDFSEMNVSMAAVTSDMSWTSFKSAVSEINEIDPDSIKVYALNGDASNAGTFMPVVLNNSGRFVFDGDCYAISDVKIDTTGAAGLFSVLNSKAAVKNLRLLDCSVNTDGNAGILAGTVNGASDSNNVVSNVIAHNSTGSALGVASSSGKAGGLIGELKGGYINGCAASVYVSGNVSGGLIGELSGPGKLFGCYSGGHTFDRQYSDEHINVSGSVAGGLVGNATGSSWIITSSYSTCSAGGSGATAGGLIGQASDGTVNRSYATGKVTGEQIGSFIGSKAGTHFDNNNYYFAAVNEFFNGKGYEELTAVGSTSNSAIDYPQPFDSDAATYNSVAGHLMPAYDPTDPDSIPADAIAYDSELTAQFKGDYYLPTAIELGLGKFEARTTFVVIHYGDWPAPESLVINTDF